jgi:hypothetical protein
LLRVLLDRFDQFFERSVLADELQGRRGSDFGNGIEVIAAEEDAQVDELDGA